MTLVGSHDTASAVVGVPAQTDDFAYISCGTWALVGLELSAPVVSDAARVARFTNEAGVDGRTRFLHNVTGPVAAPGVDQDVAAIRAWRSSLNELLAAAAALPEGGPVIDPDDEVFLPHGDMPARIETACRLAGCACSGQPARAGPLHSGQPRAGFRAHLARGGAHRGAQGFCRSHGRRRRAQRAALSAHRQRVRASGPGRAGRGHGDRQHRRPGPCARLD